MLARRGEGIALGTARAQPQSCWRVHVQSVLVRGIIMKLCMLKEWPLIECCVLVNEFYGRYARNECF